MSAGEPPDPDDYINHYIERKELHLKETSIKNLKTSLRYLREWLNDYEIEVEEVREEDAEKFIAYVEDSVSGTTAESYTAFVDRFYKYYSRRGAFETNPISLAVDNWNFDIEHREFRDLPLEEFREICQDQHRPLDVLLFTILPKTGMRISELVEMDLDDIHLDHSKANRWMPEPRYEIENEPDTLYIPPVLADNKRAAGTHVPIDDELKQALLYYLSAYYPTPPNVEHPPLLQNRKGNGSQQGDRPTKRMIQGRITQSVKPYGWYESGAPYQEKLTAHKFRHIFSDYAASEEYGGQMKNEVIQYIRGDTGGRTIDEYQHLWGTDTRTEYLNNIFKLYE